MQGMEHTKHIWRAVILLVLIPIALVLGQYAFTPKSFGVKGHYRYANLAERMLRQPRHAGRGNCAQSCHAKREVRFNSGKHKSLNCESCHGPLSQHVKNGKKFKDMGYFVNPKLQGYRLCLNCHQKLVSRPKKFPQIEFPMHLKDQEAKYKGSVIPRNICWTCHDPHKPNDEPEIKTPKVDPTKDDPKHVEPKKDAPKVEPKKDAPKVEPKKDAPKVGSPKTAPTIERPKVEPKKGAPKSVAPTHDGSNPHSRKGTTPNAPKHEVK